MGYRRVVFRVCIVLIGISCIFSNGEIIFMGNITENGRGENSYLPLAIDKDVDYEQSSTSECYGFILPLPSGEDTTEETFQNGRVHHLINDLLRENISVYWSAGNFSALCKDMNYDSTVTEMCFSPGDFIVLFSGDTSLDTILVSVMYDYNRTCEIGDADSYQIEMYQLMCVLTIEAYALIEPKIAQHFGTPVRYGWPFYLQIAEAGGFLTMEFLLENETVECLTTDDFNVFMWPYNPMLGTAYEVLVDFFNKNRSNAIRSFVRNGGGYIGSCYGAQVGAAGLIQPIPVFSLRHAYNTNLSFQYPSVSLSLSDSLMSVKLLVRKYPIYVSTIEIEDMSHPLSFGINKTTKVFFNGPWFVWLGQNTDTLARYIHFQSENNETVHERYPYNLIGSASWVNSSFGNGNVVLFGCHPEFVTNVSLLFNRVEWEGDTYYGQRIIFNALSYATSKEKELINPIITHPVWLIEDIGKKTTNLSIPPGNNSEFHDLEERINQLTEHLVFLRDISEEITEMLSNFTYASHVIEVKTTYPPRYIHYYCNIFLEYHNKTRSSLDKLEQVYPLLLAFNQSLELVADNFKSHMFWRINASENLMEQILLMMDSFQDLLDSKRNIIQKIRIITEARHLLGAVAIGLKYMPQMYFETLKFLRYCWYHYESEIFLHNDGNHLKSGERIT